MMGEFAIGVIAGVIAGWALGQAVGYQRHAKETYDLNTYTGGEGYYDDDFNGED